MLQHKQAQTIRLQDGRQLGFAEYGTPDGFPILLFHGTPGCRLWFAEDDPVALSLGLRLLALDRPGFGLSEPKAGRTVLDWTINVEDFARQLGLHNFSVLGVSGGGVYAAACAYRMPHRLQGAALVSTIAPFKKGKAPRSMCKANRIAFYLSRYARWLLQLSYKHQKKLLQTNPDRFCSALQTQVGHLCEQDKKVLQSAETAQGFLRQLEGALSCGVYEAASEPALLARDWGFSGADIHFPVQLWHGTHDTLAPFEEIKKLVTELPQGIPHYLEGAGHFIIEEQQVWTDLLKSLAPESKQDSSAGPSRQINKQL